MLRLGRGDCAGAEEQVQSRCRAGAEVQVCRCMCRGAGAIEQMQRCRYIGVGGNKE